MPVSSTFTMPGHWSEHREAKGGQTALQAVSLQHRAGTDPESKVPLLLAPCWLRQTKRAKYSLMTHAGLQHHGPHLKTLTPDHSYLHILYFKTGQDRLSTPPWSSQSLCPFWGEGWLSDLSIPLHWPIPHVRHLTTLLAQPGTQLSIVEH